MEEEAPAAAAPATTEVVADPPESAPETDVPSSAPVVNAGESAAPAAQADDQPTNAVRRMVAPWMSSADDGSAAVPISTPASTPASTPMSAPATGGPIVTPSSYDGNAGQPPSGSAAVPLKHASQKAKEGAHEEALALIDGYLAPYGKQNVSVDAVQAAAVSVRLCNELALSCMRDSSSAALLDAAYAYLKWALRAPHASPALRAVTLNNAGIYYARTGQPAAALRCLERVGKQGGVVVEDDVSVHVTLNMTTVLADLGRHAEALEKAQEAVRTLTKAERAGKPADASLLSAAYHNLAVQQERLGSSKGHVRSYRAAVQQARKGGA